MSYQSFTVVCREGWYYLLVMAFVVTGATLREINLLMMVAGMMLGPFLFNWFMVRGGLRGVIVRRVFPRDVIAGQPVTIELVAERKRRLFQWLRPGSWAITVSDKICRLSADGKPIKDEAVVAETMFWRIRTNAPTIETYEGYFPRRGRYEFGPMTLSTRFPLGLLRRRARFRTTESLIVYPKLGTLTRTWSQVFREAHLGTSRSQHQHGLLEGDFHSLRDWRDGDSRRWVHWRTSARRGELVVRQFEQQRNQDLAIVLDLRVNDTADAESAARIETAVSFAATVAASLCRQGGSHVNLAITGADPRQVQGSASNALLQEMMDLLAVAEPTTDDQLPETLSGLANQLPSGARIVVISTQAVDTSDTDRFADLLSDPRIRSAEDYIRTINVADDEASPFFVSA